MKNKFKYNLLINIFLLYSWILCRISVFIRTCCYLIIQYVPENIIPEISYDFYIKDKKLSINNVQCNMKDITKKVKLLFWLYWNSEEKSQGRLFLPKYIQFIGDCSILFIDYQLKEFPEIKCKKFNNKGIKKVIEIIDNKYKYITETKKIDIPFGEILFT